jgi:hypothetical protein
VNKFGFVLDIKNRMLQTGTEEILLHLATASMDEVRVIVFETVRLQRNSEQIVLAELEEDPGGYRTGIIDLDMTKETPIMVARTLVDAGRPIPIRAVNLSDNRVTLQKGLHIGRYHPVLRVVRCEEEPPKPSKGKAKETSVEELFLEGWKHLTDEQIKKAKAFIRTESDAFATADEPTGRTNIVQHQINTSNVKPIRQPPRRLPLAKHQEVTQMVDKIKNEGIIEDSSSPWSLFVCWFLGKTFTTMNEPDLKVWVFVNTHGSVETAHSTCIAGAGEVCSHVGAVLFALEYIHTSQASTSLWKIPKSKDVQYEPIKKIHFGNFFKSPVLNEVVQPLQGKGIVSFLKDIEEAGSSSVLMRIVEPFASEIATSVSALWINPFKNLYSEEYEHLSQEELIALAEHVNITLSSEECSEIELKTRSQSSSREWFNQRTYRITASKFKAACCANIRKPPLFLLKMIYYPIHHNIRVPALAYGKLHEKDAANAYKLYMVCHEKFEVNNIGLQLNPNFPEFGASPDTMVSCTCCCKGCLEVKCPYLLSSMTVENFVQRKNTCLLQNDNGDISLDTSHVYFYQTQMQMAITNTFYCDFVIWSPTELYVERIPFNEDFFHLKAAKAQDFHKKVVLLELMGKCFLKTNGAWCTCKGEDDGRPMIRCNDDNCNIVWYHMESVGLTNVPENE